MQGSQEQSTGGQQMTVQKNTSVEKRYKTINRNIKVNYVFPNFKSQPYNPT